MSEQKNNSAENSLILALRNNRLVQTVVAGALLAGGYIGLRQTAPNPSAPTQSQTSPATPAPGQAFTATPAVKTEMPNARESFNQKLQDSIEMYRNYGNGVPGPEGEVFKIKADMSVRLASLSKDRPDLRVQTLESLRVIISGVTYMPGPASQQNTQLLIDTANDQLKRYEQGLDRQAQPGR